jgi:hypothetical protein
MGTFQDEGDHVRQGDLWSVSVVRHQPHTEPALTRRPGLPNSFPKPESDCTLKLTFIGRTDVQNK